MNYNSGGGGKQEERGPRTRLFCAWLPKEAVSTTPASSVPRHSLDCQTATREMAFLRALDRPLLCTSGANASHDPMEASSLRVSDVKHMFGLSMTILHRREPWRLRKEDLLDIPESLSRFQRTHFFVHID